MKDKVLIFIIGMLVGAIITSIGFLVYNKSIEATVDNTNDFQVQDGVMGEPPELPTDENGNVAERPEMPDGNNMGEPPTKPDGNFNGERPEKPSGENMEKPPAKPTESQNSTELKSNNE